MILNRLKIPWPCDVFATLLFLYSIQSEPLKSNKELGVSTKTVIIGLVGALIGAVSGVVNIAIPVSYFLKDYGKSGIAGMDLIPTVLGVYLLFWSYIGFVGAILVKRFPRTGSGLLLASAIGGYLMLVSIPAWGYAGIIEFIAAILAFTEISRRNKRLDRPYPPYPPYGGYR